MYVGAVSGWVMAVRFVSSIRCACVAKPASPSVSSSPFSCLSFHTTSFLSSPFLSSLSLLTNLLGSSLSLSLHINKLPAFVLPHRGLRKLDGRNVAECVYMYDGARSVIPLVCLARGGVWVMRLLLFLSFLLLLLLAALGVAFMGLRRGL